MVIVKLGGKGREQQNSQGGILVKYMLKAGLVEC